MCNYYGTRSRAESLTLFKKNEALAHAILSRHFANAHPSDRDDLLTGALLGLWAACQRFDPLRGVAFSTFATAYIVYSIRRTINTRKKRREVQTVSLSDPLGNGGEDNKTLADVLPAPSRESCPLTFLLHREAMGEAQAAWERKPPSVRARQAVMGEEVRAVLAPGRARNQVNKRRLGMPV